MPSGRQPVGGRGSAEHPGGHEAVRGLRRQDRVSRKTDPGGRFKEGFTAPDGDAGGNNGSIDLLCEGDWPFGIGADAVVKMAKCDNATDEKVDVRGIDVQFVRGVRYEEDQEIILLNCERLFYAG